MPPKQLCGGAMPLPTAPAKAAQARQCQTMRLRLCQDGKAVLSQRDKELTVP